MCEMLLLLLGAIFSVAISQEHRMLGNGNTPMDPFGPGGGADTCVFPGCALIYHFPSCSVSGDKGDPGIAGPSGEPGAKGDDGMCPGPCIPSEGLPGGPGLPGPAGVRGLPGVDGVPGPKGQKGDMGVTGKPGDPGVVGPKGNQGADGQCNCKDGANGTNGQPGPKGNKGDQGPQGVQGVTGENGAKGDQGDMGPIGVPGPCSPAVQSAFSAALTASFPSPNRPVLFTRVIYNLQNNYDPAVGVFIAPVNGTYSFSYHLTVSDRVLKVGLFLNFLPVVKTTESTQLGTASQQVVLHLNRQDMVWIQVKDSASNGMFTSSEASSTFSGYLGAVLPISE
uniref:C1q domain-containing protein n=1 Tax=Denticeps clupeoides TaxID=299321 RepID=A0AAY4D9C6_9TELE